MSFSSTRGKLLCELALTKIYSAPKNHKKDKPLQESQNDTNNIKVSGPKLQDDKPTPTMECNLDHPTLTMEFNLDGISSKDVKESEQNTTDAEQTLQNDKPALTMELNLDEIGLTVTNGIIEEHARQCLPGQSIDSTVVDVNLPSVSCTNYSTNSLKYCYSSLVSEKDKILTECDFQDDLFIIGQTTEERSNVSFHLEDLETYIIQNEVIDMDVETNNGLVAQTVFDDECSSKENRPNLFVNNNAMVGNISVINNGHELMMEAGIENENSSINGSEAEARIENPDMSFNGSEAEARIENPDMSFNGSDSEETEYKGRPKRGRKQKHAGQSRAIRKKRKNSNELYYTSKGKEVEPKEFKNYICLCKNKCFEKVSSEVREREFKKYWELGDYNAQTAYIGALVLEQPVKRHYGKDDNNKKQFSRIYTINKIVVCRNMFVYSFGLSPKRIDSALSKIRSNSITDKRGISGGHNKLSENQIQEVVNHIKNIPKYKSHYCRDKTDREYIPTHMTLQLMYDLYKMDCSTEPVSSSKFNEIFYSRFNLRRKTYLKDTCNLCDSLHIKISHENQPERKTKLEALKEEHMTAQENARQALKDDIKLATENAEVETLTFDLEKTLSLPKIPSNIVYYKRQLSVYNLGIYAAKLDKSYCFVWMESEAGRGAQDIGSCLKLYFSKYIDHNVTHINLWSDSCGGQNRNIKIVLMLQHLLYSYPNLQSISLKFLVSGHSYLPNDTDFAFIESAVKKQMRLYTVDDFISVIQTCKKKRPLLVERMEKKDFFSTLNLEQSITNRKKDVHKEKINWFQWREITIHKNLPFVLNFKIRQGPLTPYNQLNIKKKIPGRPLTEQQTFSKELENLWPTGKPISVPKLKDIKSIMHLIPSDAKNFYKNLFSSPTLEDDIDGFNVESLDFEVELNEDLNSSDH